MDLYSYTELKYGQLLMEKYISQENLIHGYISYRTIEQTILLLFIYNYNLARSYRSPIRCTKELQGCTLVVDILRNQPRGGGFKCVRLITGEGFWLLIT